VGGVRSPCSADSGCVDRSMVAASPYKTRPVRLRMRCKQTETRGQGSWGGRVGFLRFLGYVVVRVHGMRLGCEGVCLPLSLTPGWTFGRWTELAFRILGLWNYDRACYGMACPSTLSLCVLGSLAPLLRLGPARLSALPGAERFESGSGLVCWTAAFDGVCWLGMSEAPRCGYID
jgi:hypothetical protein